MKIVTGVLVSVLLSVGFLHSAQALTSVPTSPFPISSPLIITSYGVSVDQTGVDFVQIYNTSDEVVVLDGWSLAYTTTLDQSRVAITSLEGYMLPESHYVLATVGVLTGEGSREIVSPSLAATAKLKSFVLVPSTTHVSVSEQPITGGGIYKRNTTTTGYSTSTTFTKQDPLTFTVLAADPLYIIPPVPQLRIVEILPRSAECAPHDMSLVCGDYVKLQNTSNSIYDMSNYRLRTDSGTSETSNAFSLDWMVEPGGFVTIYLKDDGSKMSLTDSGGYVWLEDAMGMVQFYDETIVKYPSASSTSKQGWSWAIGNDGIWQWTSTPQPDASNIMTTPLEEVLSVALESECPAGKYRNPETNRCKNIEEAIATLVACDEGEFRSPETNRCRKVALAATATLTPCEPGEERNPSTNRCRSINTVASALAACPEGQERNPETNRCRAGVSSSAPPAFTEAEDKGIASPYWIGGIIVTAAVGYGIYEWRAELMKLFRRFAPTTK